VTREISELIDDLCFAQQSYFPKKGRLHFVDSPSQLYGYLGHEFPKAAYDREGRYWKIHGKTEVAFFREIVWPGIRAEAPGLEIGVRMSIFDWMPFQKRDQKKTGVPAKTQGRTIIMLWLPILLGFENDLTRKPFCFLQELEKARYSN